MITENHQRKGATLSAVIITKNEESNIGRCIDSLSSVADEILVIDSFSSDRTIEIAKAKGATCVQREWLGYAATKNMGNDIARMDFILSIDADEVPSKELIASITEFKKANIAQAAQVNRITNYCGKWIRHSGWYPEYKTRIFKKSKAHWTGTIHEELIFLEKQRVVKLDGHLLHYSYPTIDSHLVKIPAYAALSAQRAIQKGEHYNFFLHALIKPWFVFIKKYFFQLGFLDGFYGFVIATLSSVERLIRYVKYREMTKR